MQTHSKFFRLVWAVPVVALPLCAGCGSSVEEQEPTEVHMPDQRITNEQTMEMNFTQQARNAAVTGGTVYPHHFVIGDAELTMVGQRHVNALLPRNAIEPVRISVPRGTASDALYEARLQTLRERFADAGYGENRFALVDELPGGEGISSDRVLLIKSEEPRPTAGAGGRAARSGAANRPAGSQTGGGSGGGSGSGSGSGGGSSSGGGGYGR